VSRGDRDVENILLKDIVSCGLYYTGRVFGRVLRRLFPVEASAGEGCRKGDASSHVSGRLYMCPFLSSLVVVALNGRFFRYDIRSSPRNKAFRGGVQYFSHTVSFLRR